MGIRTFSTSFERTENPISQSNLWINGGTTGLDWTDVRTTVGRAFGTQPGDSANQFDDSVSILSGVWGPDQGIEATVFVTATPPQCCAEVELLVRHSITANNSGGYEVTASCASSNPYISVTYWPGAKATDISQFPDISPVVNTYVQDGDVLGVTVVGSLFTVYLNGSSIIQITDTAFTTGSPGMGMFLAHQTGINSTYGFSKFACNDAGVLPSAGLGTHASNYRPISNTRWA